MPSYNEDIVSGSDERGRGVVDHSWVLPQDGSQQLQTRLHHPTGDVVSCDSHVIQLCPYSKELVLCIHGDEQSCRASNTECSSWTPTYKTQTAGQHVLQLPGIPLTCDGMEITWPASRTDMTTKSWEWLFLALNSVMAKHLVNTLRHASWRHVRDTTVMWDIHTIGRCGLRAPLTCWGSFVSSSSSQDTQ